MQCTSQFEKLQKSGFVKKLVRIPFQNGGMNLEIEIYFLSSRVFQVTNANSDVSHIDILAYASIYFMHSCLEYFF